MSVRPLIVVLVALTLPVTLWAAATGPCESTPSTEPHAGHAAHHDAGNNAPADDSCLCCGDCAMLCSEAGHSTAVPAPPAGGAEIPARHIAAPRRNACAAGPPLAVPFRPPITLH